ncbi:TlpA disulfide reductase family protein [Chitinophaga sancti]|uniref:Thioredoxin-like n=2 Tax=Chitinophaga sancti TaxID=1004 RepID=A0A1K1NZ65_9BACT|nr:TlpA disulfide reductase family protein [Chitinophaga sancti]WQD60318.1 TlpA disulfide reductase family protein [Chitinophaga sancti]WQG87554.1 TlpA disulfide reductase family protein [Chitinophaga sancti]SFW40531.1 Thioredoxin-like [Chitinophaga sancti]
MTRSRLFTLLQHSTCLLCLCLLGLCSINVSAQLKFRIEGHIDNTHAKPSKNDVGDSDIIVLNFGNLVRKDTVRIHNNAFHMEGEIPYPSSAFIEYKYGGNLILLDSSSYLFTLVKKDIDSTHATYEQEIKTKSTFHNTWEKFYDNKAKLVQERNQLNEAAQHTTNPDSALYYAFAIKAANKKIVAFYHQFAADHPNSYIAAYILVGAPDFSYANYMDVYSSFSDNIKNSYYGKNFYSRMIASKDDKKEEQAKTEIAQTAPGMFPVTNTIDTALNKIVLDKDFFSKHKYTLIEFWASWCGPCRKLNENLKKMTASFKEKDVELVGFSLDQGSEAWKIAMINDKLPWLQVSDLKAVDSPLAQYLKLGVIPANVLVDREGKIVRTNIYEGELEGFLKGVN